MNHTPDPVQRRWNAIDDALCAWLGGEDESLLAAQRDSVAAGLPAIAVAPAQGRMLEVLARAVGARRILEIGTLGGYSTIWLARALPAGPRAGGPALVSLEIDPRHASVARANLARAGVGHIVEIIEGAALDSLDRMIAERCDAFDFIFIDADKENCANYLDRALALSRAGTLIVVDNIVRRGRVVDADTGDPSIDGVREMLSQAGRDGRLVAAGVQTTGSKGYDGFLLATVVETPARRDQPRSTSEIPATLELPDAGCCLRRWRSDDIASLVRNANNERVSRTLFDRFPFPYTTLDAAAWIELAMHAESDLHLAIDCNGEAIGGISAVFGSDVTRHSAELGYWLGEPHWERGIMTSAVRAFCAALFAHTGVERIEASAFANNPASARVLAKAGFALEGTLRRRYFKHGTYIDGTVHSLLRPR